MPNYKSTLASIIGAIIVYLQSKQYIDNDISMLIMTITTAVFGSINMNNHIKWLYKIPSDRK